MNLSKIFQPKDIILKGDDRLLPYQENPIYKGNPDGLIFARDNQDVVDVLKTCHAKKIPVTFAGSQTAITGASTNTEGLIIALEKKNRFLDIGIKDNKAYAKAEPGILLGNFKEKIKEQGFFYPPDPTSYLEAQLGGTVSTNATGEDSFFYGPTRPYIYELKVLTADGQIKVLKRNKPYQVSHVKNKAGYCLDGEEIDLMIGSEGTLGLITEVTVNLLPFEEDHFVLLVPFVDFKECLEFTVQTIKSQALKPRALELIGPGAYEIFSEQKDVPLFSEATNCLLYLKQNFSSGTQKELWISQYLDFIQKFNVEKRHRDLSKFVFYADTPKAKKQIRAWRHYIPAIVNERNKKWVENGGGKISTDWWVPTEHLVEMMMDVYQQNLNWGGKFIVFAHIGNGHPHWNYLCQNKKEWVSGHALVENICKKAVSLGGGVAGEHGVGKIHYNYLSIQHDLKTINTMKEIKTKWDPHWILGRGNLFEYDKNLFS